MKKSECGVSYVGQKMGCKEWT